MRCWWWTGAQQWFVLFLAKPGLGSVGAHLGGFSREGSGKKLGLREILVEFLGRILVLSLYVRSDEQQSVGTRGTYWQLNDKV